jgi:dTDP-4-amino-4,6-dideoxygalactose transaminase
MIISARPYPDIREPSSQRGCSVVDRMRFYPLGRDALLSGLVTLGLKKGDSVIIPAYMCYSTIEPLKAYGFNLLFIDIEKSLRLSVDKLKEVIEGNQIKALLVVHYFGLTQDIQNVTNVCRDCGVKVIEDASHSFMSQFLRNKDVVKGDAEIFSMRKSLPIVDGGALRIHQSGFYEAKNNNTKCVSTISDLRYLILRILERIVTSLGINIYGQFINNIKTKLRINNINENTKFNIRPCQASWQLSKYLGNDKYLQNSQKIIVNNFNHLSQALQNLGFRLLVESIEKNVVPQACIVYDDTGGLVDYLRSNGVGAWRWPDEEILEEVSQNPAQYPNAVFFDESLVLIPIHQSLGDKQINYIIQVLSKWQL